MVSDGIGTLSVVGGSWAYFCVGVVLFGENMDLLKRAGLGPIQRLQQSAWTVLFG